MEQENQPIVVPVVEVPKKSKVQKEAIQETVATDPTKKVVETPPVLLNRKSGCQNTWQTIVCDDDSQTRALYIEKLGCLVEVTNIRGISTTFIDGCKIGKCPDGNPKLIFAG